jgi:lipid-binding SYLF domain-containing protein
MKPKHKLLIAGLAFSALVGTAPAFGQDAPKAHDPAESANPTTARPPADDKTPIRAEKTMSIEEKRTEINTMARAALETVFDNSARAKELYDTSYGYAVFDNLKLGFLVTGEGGKGVAIAKKNMNDRTYMNMGSAGIGASVGAQRYQVVFLFETRERFANFVNEGWSSRAAANAVAGESTKNYGTSFVDGIAVYQINEKGVMVNADISGTKFWRDDELNGGPKEERTNR